MTPRPDPDNLNVDNRNADDNGMTSASSPPLGEIGGIGRIDGEAVFLADPATANRGMAARIPGQGPFDEARDARRRHPISSRLGRVVEANTEERAWRTLANGERSVAKTLEGLGPSWTILHDVPTDSAGGAGGRVSHLAIGPGGVIAISTRPVRGQVVISETRCAVHGLKTDYVTRTIEEARRVQGLLDDDIIGTVPVTPILVLLCERITVQVPPLACHVVSRKRLIRLIGSLPVLLATEEIAAIVKVASSTATWEGRLPGARRRRAKAEAAAQRSAALESQVNHAADAEAAGLPRPGEPKAWNPASHLSDRI